MNQEKRQALELLKTARGQIEGIMKMIETERYCVDISNQILAVSSILKKSNGLILRQHMNSCVRDAFLKGEGEEKVDEVMMLFDKVSR
ncbi:MAG: transcriptional regulator [delta proteobacterium ML8_F1]|nr:MAG: transcriptional regulator [delta proteobacterium ML8_F1]